MKKLLLKCMVVLIFSATYTYAQDSIITGTVTSSEDGTPLPGVSVKTKASNYGTQTDAAGKFTIRTDKTTTLIFNYIGYLPKEVVVTTGSQINVVLTVDVKQLNEVVVVGYGTQERKNLTGSYAHINGSEFTDQPVASFDQTLAGKATGVQVTVSNGILGSPPLIRIRGVSSITNGSDPLYVVDGFPVITGVQSGITSNNPLGDINPNDIQSIDVLKDGSATAIYGSRASGGVIIITTKKGVIGKPKLTYDSWFATASPSKRFNLLDAQQFITIANEKLTNAGVAQVAFPTLDANGNAVNTDWQNVIFNNSAFQQNHALSVSGATPQSNYYFSLGYANLNGIIKDNSQTKYQLRGKMEQKVWDDKLTIGINSAVSYIDNYGLNSVNNALSGNVIDALYALPNVPVFNNDGSYNLNIGNNSLGEGANKKKIDGSYTNIKYILDHNVYRNQNLNLLGNAFANVSIIEGLNLRTQVSVNGLFGEDYVYLNPVQGDARTVNGREYQQYIPSFRYNWSNTLSYDKTIGSHNINVLGGVEFQKTRYRSFSASGNNLSSLFFAGENIIDNSLAQSTFNIGGTLAEQAYKSFFGRANYSFKDRYLLSVTFRGDAISALPIGNQYAYLPGASLGWRISEEPFFKALHELNFINNLKLRVGYAKVGNTDIGNYPAYDAFNAAVYGSQSGLVYARISNPELNFETSKKYNTGLDIGFLKDRITVTADYFKNDMDNLIVAAPTAPSLGVPGNTINENVGSMTDKGFELSVNTVNLKNKDFSWSTNFNLTLVKNQITALSNNNADINYTYNIDRVGESIGSIYCYQFAGVNPANGNPLYVKGNGAIIQGNVTASAVNYYLYDAANPTVLTTPSTLSSTSDMVVLGNTAPTYFGGLNNTVAYKGFDFSVFITFSGGNKVLNITRQESLLSQKFVNNGTEILDRWTTPGQITNIPRLVYGSSDNSINLSGSAVSRFVEDGRYIRGQNITLGYSLPKALLSKLKVNRVRVFADVQNAFIITPYTGLDPELNLYNGNSGNGTANNIQTNNQQGLDYNTNPKARTYSFGINVGF